MKPERRNSTRNSSARAEHYIYPGRLPLSRRSASGHPGLEGQQRRSGASVIRVRLLALDHEGEDDPDRGQHGADDERDMRAREQGLGQLGPGVQLDL